MGPDSSLGRVWLLLAVLGEKKSPEDEHLLDYSMSLLALLFNLNFLFWKLAC